MADPSSVSAPPASPPSSALAVRVARVTLNHRSDPGMFGMKRYTLELADGLRRRGVEVRLRGTRAREIRLGRLRLGGSVTEQLRTWVPVSRRGLLHATDHHSNPRLTPAQVVTVHDLIPWERPELASAAASARDERAGRHAVRTARRILTDTRHVAGTLVHRLGASPDQVVPIHLGVRHDVFFPDPAPVAEAGGGPGPFRPGRLNVLCAVGNEPRKRLDLVAEAALGLPFAHLVQVGGTAAATSQGAWARHLASTLGPLRAEGRFVQAGAVDDATLRRLYSQADVVVHPSEAEGFGLPPLEAMACGARVVASAIPPLQEILGPHARYAALDAAALARELERDWDGSAVREAAFPALQGRLRHARSFTWERTVDATLDVYAQAQAQTP